MPLPITHLFITILAFDIFRDIARGIRIRNRDLALIGLLGVLPDIDILLVPFLGWNIHKIWTHTLLAILVLTVIMLILAFLLSNNWEGRILFGLGVIAYGAHILLDFIMRSVPLFYPWDRTSYGMALLGSPLEYLRFSMLDTSIFGFFFLFFLVTGFSTFRYPWNYPPARLWYQITIPDEASSIIKGWFGFIKKHPLSWRIDVRILPKAKQGQQAGIPRIQLKLWSIEDPLELHYGSTFYEGIGELAHDAGLFIRLASVQPHTTDNKGTVTIELLPAKFTGLMELIQRLTGRQYFGFQTEGDQTL